MVFTKERNKARLNRNNQDVIFSMEVPSLDIVKDLHILLVDDDNFTRRVIRHILYGLGIAHVDDAYNGENALTFLDKQNYDLLITDVQMPKLNGLELLKTVRSGKAHTARDLRTIIITSFANTEVLGAALALDANGFLVKPMKPAGVSQKISEALKESGHLRAVADYEAIPTDLPFLQSKSENSRQPINASIVVERRQRPRHRSADTDTDGVLIRDLEPGMRLSRDLYLTDGTLLLSEGYIINDTTINRLFDLRNMLSDELIPVLPEERGEA